jgi:hypothetical protein
MMRGASGIKPGIVHIRAFMAGSSASSGSSPGWNAAARRRATPIIVIVREGGRSSIREHQ